MTSLYATGNASNSVLLQEVVVFFLLVFPDLVCAVVNLINTLVILHPQGKMVNFVKCKYRKKTEVLCFLFMAVSILSLALCIRKAELHKSLWGEPSDPQRHHAKGFF